jgi:ribonuclease HIII
MSESKSWIGMDESGKGDYFGPLVTAAVCVDSKTAGELTALGVRDSKRVSDARAASLAQEIRRRCPHSLVTIGPARYNELYAKIKNLNRLLAWAHARTLENLLEQLSGSGLPRHALADQFGDERYILQALMEKGRRIRLEQRPRAEEDPAVAAASILARDEFLRRLEQLSVKIGADLPKGASSLVVDAAKGLVTKQGPDALRETAKLHFKTTEQVLGRKLS